MSLIIVSSHIQKSTKILHGDVCSSWLAVTCTRLAEIFCEKYMLDCMHSPFTKITYILTFPPASLEQFLRAIWDAVSQAAVLILPQIKLNSQLSRCAFFLSPHCLWGCRLLIVSSHGGRGFRSQSSFTQALISFMKRMRFSSWFGRVMSQDPPKGRTS